MAGFGEKDETLGKGESFQPRPTADLEGQRKYSSAVVQGRKMSRIAPPPRTGSQAVPPPVLADDVSSQDEFTKLVEMEAEDAIKYRTCSWQKVNSLRP